MILVYNVNFKLDGVYSILYNEIVLKRGLFWKMKKDIYMICCKKFLYKIVICKNEELL